MRTYQISHRLKWRSSIEVSKVCLSARWINGVRTAIYRFSNRIGGEASEQTVSCLRWRSTCKNKRTPYISVYPFTSMDDTRPPATTKVCFWNVFYFSESNKDWIQIDYNARFDFRIISVSIKNIRSISLFLCQCV